MYKKYYSILFKIVLMIVGGIFLYIRYNNIHFSDTTETIPQTLSEKKQENNQDSTTNEPYITRNPKILQLNPDTIYDEIRKDQEQCKGETIQECYNEIREKYTISFQDACDFTQERKYDYHLHPLIVLGEKHYIPNFLKKGKTIWYTQYFGENVDFTCELPFRVYQYDCETKENTIIFDKQTDAQTLLTQTPVIEWNMICGLEIIDSNDEYIVFSGLPREGAICGPTQNFFLFDRDHKKLELLTIINDELGQGENKPVLILTGFENSNIVQQKIDNQWYTLFGEEETNDDCTSYTLTIDHVDMDSGDAEFSARFYLGKKSMKYPFRGNIYEKILY